jgi:hypothetical protein
MIPITKYCKDNAEHSSTPQRLTELLTEAGYIQCLLPLSIGFKQAYDLAIEMVGPEHFMVVSRVSFWFEDNITAVQFRLSLK